MTHDNAGIAAYTDPRGAQTEVKTPTGAEPSPADPMPSQTSPRLPDVAVLLVLRGQAALVTGANSGIGRAVALALGQAGADVVVNYVTDPDAAQAVVDQIRSLGRRALAIHADASREDEVDAMFARGGRTGHLAHRGL